MRRLRRDIQIVFQDPYTSLNPRMTVGDIVGEPFEIHTDVRAQGRPPRSGSRSCSIWSGSTPSTSTGTRTSSPAASGSGSASPAALALQPEGDHLRRAGLGARRLRAGPGRQPARGAAGELGLAYIFIAHDLSVVRHISDRVGVMYLGKIVEIGDEDADLRPPDPPVHPGPAVRGAGAGSRRCATPRADRARPATCRARPTRPPAAGSTPAAGRRRRSARVEEPLLDRAP